MKDKKYRKVRDHSCYTGEYRGAAHNICNLKYSVPKKVPIAFHNGSNYDYHFIIKELTEEFKKQFTCLGEKTEQYITFTVPIEKEVTTINKNGKETTKNISYILQARDSGRFISCSFSNLVNNLSEGIHEIKPKHGHHYNKCKTYGITYEVCDYLLECRNFKEDLIEYKCLCCNKYYQQKLDEKLKERFFNTYNFLTMTTINLFYYW